jgi:hypothetical protein
MLAHAVLTVIAVHQRSRPRGDHELIPLTLLALSIHHSEAGTADTLKSGPLAVCASRSSERRQVVSTRKTAELDDDLEHSAFQGKRHGVETLFERSK